MEVRGHLHTPAALFPGESHQYPLHRRLGGPQSRSGFCSEGKRLHYCPCRKSNTGRPTRSL